MCSMPLRNAICDALRIVEKEDLDCYLDLPTHIGINKKEILCFIKDCLWKRLNSWKCRCFYRAVKR